MNTRQLLLTTRVIDADREWKDFIAREKDNPWNHSEWFQMGHLSVYLRCGRRAVYVTDPAVPVSVVTLSSANIGNYKAMGTGLFRRFVTELEAHAASIGIEYVLVENVLNDDLRDRQLPAHGYANVPGTYLGSPTMYKRLTPQKTA